MRRVLYPGSFDPVTLGHMDIIARASRAFEQVVVGVLHNPNKPSGMLPVEERLSLLRLAVRAYDHIEVASFSGLLMDAVRAAGADGVVRGLRGVEDVPDELQMARLNRQLGGVETVFLAASPGIAHISSARVREIARFGGAVDALVPEAARDQIVQALRRYRE